MSRPMLEDKWLDLGDSVYFLTNNRTHSWRIEFLVDHENRKNGWTVSMDGEEHVFPTLDEAKGFVEATHALSVE